MKDFCFSLACLAADEANNYIMLAALQSHSSLLMCNQMELHAMAPARSVVFATH